MKQRTAALWISLLAVALTPSAQAAYATAELYGPALQQAVSVQTAQNELAQARAEVARLQADPLALKPARMAAEARLQQAGAGLRLSELQVRAALAGDLETLSGAEYAVRLARARQELAGLRLTAAQVRHRAGALTALDLDAARAEASNAAAATAQAQASVDAARQRVQERTGRRPQAQLKLGPAPTLSGLQAALEQHPRLIKARAEVAAAALDLQVKSTDLSAPVEVQAAQVALTSARSAEAETRLELEAALSTAWQTYQSALSALAPAERSWRAAAEQQNAQQKRFDAGLISKAALLQSRLDTLEAQSALDSRQAAAETALAQLSVAANLKAWN